MIGNKTINDVQAVPEKFNNFFGSIEEKLAKSVSKRFTSFKSFVKLSHKPSIFVKALSSYQIFKIIENLNVNKSLG